jgi:rfaE bifunctional protein nucleotidyltransferase chain/domain
MSLRDKIIARDQLADALSRLPRPLVFTNGVFDLMHPGHVSYLADARALGAGLFIGLNSNLSARLLGKGQDRPIVDERDRAIMLAALESVSAVCYFDEQTPVSLIEEVRPDIYVKGGDYDIETLAETRLVRSWGGDARAIPFLDGYSTTSLLTRIRAATA